MGARGKGRYPDANPPTQTRVLPEETRRGGTVAERGKGKGGRAGETDPGYSSPEKDTIGRLAEGSQLQHLHRPGIEPGPHWPEEKHLPYPVMTAYFC